MPRSRFYSQTVWPEVVGVSNPVAMRGRSGPYDSLVFWAFGG